MANRYAAVLVSIEEYLSVGERPVLLTVLLDKYRCDLNTVKKGWHEMFPEISLQHPELHGVNHAIAACCLKRLNPAMVGQGARARRPSWFAGPDSMGADGPIVLGGRFSVLNPSIPMLLMAYVT